MFTSRLSNRLPSALKSASKATPSSSSTQSCSTLAKSFSKNLKLSSSSAVVNTSAADVATTSTRSLSTMSNSTKSNEREVVTFIGLNNLSDNPGAAKRGRRVGRGIGSSKGKTCGKGHKGQKSRAGGGPSPLFEGGQTPFYKRIPKRGFTNNHATPMTPINVGMLQDYIDMGRLVVTEKNNTEPFTMKDLVEAGMAKPSSIKHGIKLLGKGKERLRTPFRIEISRASSGAIDAIEKVGGQITTVHYNKLALRALLKPHKFATIPKRARPPPKLMQYYTDHDKRGYLSPEKQLQIVVERLGEADVETKKEE